MQLFRDGALEAVGVRGNHIVTARDDTQGMFAEGSGDGLVARRVEGYVIGTLRKWRDLWLAHGEPGPMMLGLTLTGVQGLRLFPGSEGWCARAVNIDRDVLLIPEVVAEDLQAEVDTMILMGRAG